MAQHTRALYRSSISIRLAKIGILAVIFAGFLTSAVTIYLDFEYQAENVSTRIENILKSYGETASDALASSNDQIVDDVLEGLLNIQIVDRVSITDNTGLVIASEGIVYRQQPAFLLDILASDIPSEYSYPLKLGNDESNLAKLHLSINKQSMFSGFTQRAKLSIIQTAVSALVITAFLLGAFYVFLANPLKSIAAQIDRIDPSKPERARIKKLRYSKDDELALVVDNSNHLLEMVEEALKRHEIVEHNLRDSERQLSEVINEMPVVVAAFNEAGKFLFANKAFATMVECDSYQQVMSLHADEVLISHFGYSEELVVDFWEDLFYEGRRSTLPDTSYQLAGVEHVLQVECIPMQLFSQSAGFLVAVDVSALKAAHKDIEHMAYRDALTGLPNRYRLSDQLDKELQESKKSGKAGAAIYVDLDRFKPVNDLLGHATGDAVLCEISKRLLQVTEKTHFVARISGDEFMILIPAISQDRDDCAKTAMKVGEEIVQAIAHPIFHGSSEIRVTASLGILLFPDSADTAEKIMMHADTAMYEVKRQSRGSIEFFDADLASRIESQWQLEQELGRAFVHEEFEVYYQPKVDIKTNAVLGVEALLRWNHPEKGMIAAGEFIDILQSMSIFTKVSDWAKRVALEQVQHWHKQGVWREGMRVSLNVSPAEFVSDDFADSIRTLVEGVGVTPSMVEFEILESAAFEDLDSAMGVMANLVADGFRFALDDFGTGFSSMNCLRQLPLSVLKIDKSFITGLGSEFNDRVLVEAVIRLAQLLKLEIIAEGVESQRELDLLKKLGCDYYQGFYFSEAVDAGKIQQMLSKDVSVTQQVSV